MIDRGITRRAPAVAVLSRWSAAASPSECDADGSTASGLRTSLVDKHNQRHNVIFALKYTAPNFLSHVSVATDMEARAKLDYAKTPNG